jgi:flagellar hook-associated protein 3 FlgL
MRLTDATMGNRLLADLQRSYTRMATTQQQVSTGRRVNRPSDDPVAAGAERLQTSALEGIRRSQASVSAASSWLAATESGLSSVNDVLARARELAVQGANGATDQKSRDLIAGEIDQLARSAKDAMNVKFGDSYIFSGTKSDTPPYAAGSDTYLGDDKAVVREAGTAATLQVNPPFSPVVAAPPGTPQAITADTILGQGAGAGDGRVLDVLAALAAHLRAGTSVQGDLQGIDANQRALSDARAAVGASSNRADAATSRLADLEDLTTQGIDDLTGVDLAKAMTDFTTQQSAYQAALKVGASIIQPSLLDFLT